MKMWAVKTVHLPERVRNFSRYKRLILASLISAILIISIIYISFLPTAQSGSDGSYKYFELYIENVTMYNMSLKGPYIFNTTEGSINVTKVTAINASISEMLLLKEGSRLELGTPSAFATKLMIYTTYLNGTIPFDSLAPIEVYGNSSVNVSLPGSFMIDTYMKVVYLEAESFLTSGLLLTYT